MTASDAPARDAWPALPLDAWADTYATLHRWTQIVGKIRLKHCPWMNHGWHVTLYVTPRGLTTGPMFIATRGFQIDFDFVAHRLLVVTSDGRSASIPLEPQSVATFYRRLWHELGVLDLPVTINTKPNEVADPVPFEHDERHSSYDADYASRFWRVLLQCERVFRQFRSGFVGKCSPVHFFWGAADLAVTRFSGRPAPIHPGGITGLPDAVTREAYSQEVISCGFWPGGGAISCPAFFAYAYPEPKGFAQSRARPGAAFYSDDLREFVLPYDAVRLADLQDAALLDFLQSTYDAAAELGGWARDQLERQR